jgi:N-acetyl-gamma-glutamyl-phosphate reductase
MRVHGLLRQRPLFVPSVGRFRQGMLVQVPLQLWALPDAPSVDDLHDALAEAYREQTFVSVADRAESEGLATLDPEGMNGTNNMRIFVFGNEDRRQALLVALLDNLGKGASGAAVQNLNLMTGCDAVTGLAA